MQWRAEYLANAGREGTPSDNGSEVGSGNIHLLGRDYYKSRIQRTLFSRSRPLNLNDNVSVPFEFLRKPR